MFNKNPNSHQVGGEHYQSEYQHWDFVHNALCDRYYEGCITKYATRWSKKNGVQDVHKALHYLDKLQDLYGTGQIGSMQSAHRDRSMDTGPLSPIYAGIITQQVHDYIAANRLHSMEEQMLMSITSMWDSLEDLRGMRQALHGILSMAEAKAELANEMRQENP